MSRNGLTARRRPRRWQCAVRRGLRLSLLPLLRRLQPATDDLLRDPLYRRLWSSIFISTLGGQITLLAIPLTAAALLDARPTQMGWLTAMETLPFALFCLPVGVWLDRVRKLPVYVVGELSLAVVLGSVPLAWSRGWLSMTWLYVVAFLTGLVFTIAGSAAQIVLTQIVPRERLVEAHAKNALASSAAEVTGPAAAGALIKIMGAPLALLADVLLLLASAGILRGISVQEGPRHGRAHFWDAMRLGIGFVAGNRLLITMALTVGTFELCYQSALVVQILVATRLLGLSEHQIGLSYVALGAGTVIASAVGHAVTQRYGPGPALVLGFAICACGWLALALAPAGTMGIIAFACTLAAFGLGAVFVFINFLALRQAVTPAPLLGRMTSTMRWLIMLPGIPGALCGGWLGEHLGLKAALGFSGLLGLALALVAIRLPILREMRALPEVDRAAAARALALNPGA